MKKFNPENKESLTYGDCLEPAMKITDPEEAQQYLKDYADYIQKWRDKESMTDNSSPLEVAKQNLAYYAGYGSNELRERVERLFLCAHPIFGSVKDNGIPTGKEAFECGKQGKTLNEIRIQ